MQHPHKHVIITVIVRINPLELLLHKHVIITVNLGNVNMR